MHPRSALAAFETNGATTAAEKRGVFPAALLGGDVVIKFLFDRADGPDGQEWPSVVDGDGELQPHGAGTTTHDLQGTPPKRAHANDGTITYVLGYGCWLGAVFLGSGLAREITSPAQDRG